VERTTVCQGQADRFRTTRWSLQLLSVEFVGYEGLGP
jgi:hypothetical protein